jgi:Rod binding domain-containing protein
MLVETIGTRMAQHGGIGLADAIVRALMQGQEAQTETKR